MGHAKDAARCSIRCYRRPIQCRKSSVCGESPQHGTFAEMSLKGRATCQTQNWKDGAARCSGAALKAAPLALLHAAGSAGGADKIALAFSSLRSRQGTT